MVTQVHRRRPLLQAERRRDDRAHLRQLLGCLYGCLTAGRQLWLGALPAWQLSTDAPDRAELVSCVTPIRTTG